MIKNKNQLKIRLKEDKDSLVFITLKNQNFPEVVGKARKVNIVQTNAFTLLTYKRDGEIVDSYIWYNNIKVKDNIISYIDEKGNPYIEISIVELDTITRQKYNEMPEDYKVVINGIPHILKLENGATVLSPIRIIE